MAYQFTQIERAFHQGYEARSKYLISERDERNRHTFPELRRAWNEGWDTKERTANLRHEDGFMYEGPEAIALSQFMGEHGAVVLAALENATYLNHANEQITL